MSQLFIRLYLDEDVSTLVARFGGGGGGGGIARLEATTTVSRLSRAGLQATLKQLAWAGRIHHMVFC